MSWSRDTPTKPFWRSTIKDRASRRNIGNAFLTVSIASTRRDLGSPEARDSGFPSRDGQLKQTVVASKLEAKSTREALFGSGFLSHRKGP